jgi:hypothetical protein
MGQRDVWERETIRGALDCACVGACTGAANAFNAHAPWRVFHRLNHFHHSAFIISKKMGTDVFSPVFVTAP